MTARSAIALGGFEQDESATSWELTGNLSAGGEQLNCTLPFFSFSFLFPFSSFLLNTLHLNPQVLALLPFFDSLPYPTAAE